MRRFVSSRGICRILGVNQDTIHRWLALGILKPIKTPYGRGYRNRFSLLTVLAFAVGRDLRKRGFSTKQVGNIVNWLYGRSPEELESEWNEGRTLLLAVGETPPYPRLLTRKAVFGNPAIDLEAAFKLGLPIAVIDVAEAYRQIVAKLSTEPKRERCPA